MVKTYTRFVILGKNFLWVLVALMIVLVVWIASDNTGEGGSRVNFSNIRQSANLQNIMQKPHYQGVDARNNPYTVTASTATQQDKDTVLLDTLRADMMNKNGAWTALNAGAGVLNTATKILEMSDGVEVFYDGGYQFRTARAHVDIDQGTATGDLPIQGQGPVGTLEAKTFSILDHGNVIHFNDSVRMVLYQ